MQKCVSFALAPQDTRRSTPAACRDGQGMCLRPHRQSILPFEALQSRGRCLGHTCHTCRGRDAYTLREYATAGEKLRSMIGAPCAAGRKLSSPDRCQGRDTRYRCQDHRPVQRQKGYSVWGPRGFHSSLFIGECPRICLQLSVLSET